MLDYDSPQWKWYHGLQALGMWLGFVFVAIAGLAIAAPFAIIGLAVIAANVLIKEKFNV